MCAAFRVVFLSTVVVLTSGTARAEQISGIVKTVSGDVVTIAVTSERLPGVGDTVQVFGAVPGLDSEVLIGRGKITEARNGTILAKVDARGKLTPGQTARITSSQAPGATALPSPPPAAEFVELFNGRDLTGWQTPPDSIVIWQAVDGVLRSDAGVRGWLFSQREYADFELQAEYRLSQGANGGIVIRAPSPDASFGPNDSSHQGLEIQLIDDISLPDDAPANQHSGAIWGVVGPDASQERPPEQWNSLRVTVRGRRIAIALNGTPTVDVDLDQYSELAEQFPGLRRAAGYLGLQAYVGRVEFRKLSLRPLGVLDGATGSTVTTFPVLPNVLEIRGRVSEVLAGDATVQIEGTKLPNVGDLVDFDRPLNTPDFKVRRVGRGKVREVLGSEIFVALDAESGSVTPGDQARIAVGNSPTPAPPLPAAPPTVMLSPSFPPTSVPPALPGSLPFTPTRLDWLAVELNAFARIQTLATERFTLMFTPRPTDDAIIIYVRYLPNVNQDDLRGAIREARNIINIITKRHGWDGWVNVVEDVAAM